MVAPASPVSGGELLLVIQDEQLVYVTRAQALTILGLAGIKSPSLRSVLTERTGTERFRALQGGNLVDLSLAELQTFFQSSSAPGDLPLQRRPDLFTGTERFVVHQGVGIAAADVLQTLYLRGMGGSLAGLGGDTPSPTPTPTPTATPPVGLTMNGASMSTLKARLAAVKAGTGRLTWIMLGDSTTAGAGAGTGGQTNTINARPGRPSALFAAKLLAAGIPALDHGGIGDNAIYTTNSVSLPQYDPRFTFTGAAAMYQLPTSLGGGFIDMGGGGGSASVSYAPGGSVKAFRVWLTPISASPLTIALDGAPPAIGPATYTPTVNSNGDWVSFVVEAATAGTHTLTVSTAVGGRQFLAFFEAYDPAIAAVDIINASVCGATSAAICASAPQTDGLHALEELAYLQPHFTTINAGINDSNIGTPNPSAYQANIAAAIAKAKAYGDVMVIFPHPLTSPNNYTTYRDAAAAAAAAAGVPIFSLYDYFGGAFPASKLLDGVHPLPAGYADIVAAEFAAINYAAGGALT